MTGRHRTNMRRLVDNTVALVRAGELSAELAAQKLHDSGVPMAVIGRVLNDIPVAQVSTLPKFEERSQRKPHAVASRAAGHSGWRQRGWLSLALRG